MHDVGTQSQSDPATGIKLQPTAPTRMLMVTHVVGSLDDQAGGPAYSVPRLCKALAEEGHRVSLLSLGSGTGDTRVEAEVAVYAHERFPTGGYGLSRIDKLGSSSALRDAVHAQSRHTDVLHTHGLWRFTNIYPADASRRTGRPFVVSPRGMFARNALRFSQTSKRLFWIAFQKRAISAASLLHATCEQEYQDIRAFGLTQPVAIIPNGIGPPSLEHLPQAPSGPYREQSGKTVLFLGRLHPVKAIDRLVQAWYLLGEQSAGWRLRIVGPAESGYDKEIAKLVSDLGLENVDLSGPVNGNDKWWLLRFADLTVLPSLSENFGMAAAESLAAETPVIASRGTPWQGLETNGCGWWVDNTPDELAKTLKAAMALMPQARTSMGQRGRVWVEHSFSWTCIAGQMAAVYAWLHDGGNPPGCVLTA